MKREQSDAPIIAERGVRNRRARVRPDIFDEHWFDYPIFRIESHEHDRKTVAKIDTQCIRASDLEQGISKNIEVND
jgi:hypothetical protein